MCFDCPAAAALFVLLMNMQSQHLVLLGRLTHLMRCACSLPDAPCSALAQAEMERHRAQLADAAIEEQLEVQTAFREQGALLQVRAEHKPGLTVGVACRRWSLQHPCTTA